MQSADPGAAEGPAIRPRNIHFEFDETLPVDWQSGEPAITHFYDALSLTFPEGERFFVNSVREFAGRIADPDLKQRVRAFTAQESIHSREHAHYNSLLGKHGIPVEKVERLMSGSIGFAERWLPAKTRLAATAAYEHYTALFAEAALGDPRVLAGAHPFYRDLWRWHAMEEEEHKSVAFDVYETVAPGFTGYLRRVLVMGFATFDFMVAIPMLQAWLMAKRGKLWDLRSWARAFRHLWISPGVWRHVMFGVFAYFSPYFHPDNRKVSPEVLAWRRHYRAMSARPPAMSPTLFGEGG
jgi:predicted metal-dependent hydrolase